MVQSTPGRLILVRHGESEGNAARRFTTNPEIELTELGWQQAHAAGAKIRSDFQPQRIVASSFRRAQQTASAIAAAVGLAIETEHELRERDFGVYAGRPYDSVFEDPAFDMERRWQWTPEGGESLLDVSARVVPATQRIAAANPGADVVVVSHGGVMLALSAHFAGSWDGIQVAHNCGIIVVEHQGERYSSPVFWE